MKREFSLWFGQCHTPNENCWNVSLQYNCQKKMMEIGKPVQPIPALTKQHLAFPSARIIQQEVGSGRLPTHDIMMTTYSPQHIHHNTCIIDLWKKSMLKGETASAVVCLCWWRRWGNIWSTTKKTTQKQISHLTKSCLQLLNTALNAFAISLLFFLPHARACTRARVPTQPGAHTQTCSPMHCTGQEPLTVPVPATDRCLASPQLRWMFAQRTPASAGDCTDPRGTIQLVSASQLLTDFLADTCSKTVFD